MEHYLEHVTEDDRREFLDKFPACEPKEWAIMDEFDNPAEFYDSREAALAHLVIYNIEDKYDEFCVATRSELGVSYKIIKEAILDYLLTPSEKQKLAG